jgi:hypothetical protein
MIETETASVAAAPAPPTPAESTAEPAPAPAPAHEPELEPEPMVEHVVEHVSAAFVPPVEEHETNPEPVHDLPSGSQPDPEPAADVESRYGWAREDTREFEPIATLPELDPEPEPEHRHEEPSRPVAEPVLEPIRGAGSHDFDWGE